MTGYCFQFGVLGPWLYLALAPFTLSNLHAEDTSKVVAYVGKQPITESDVDFQLGRRRFDIDGKTIRLPELSAARFQATIHLIGLQRQALQTLRKQKLATSREAVERWLEENGQPQDGSTRKLTEIIRLQCESFGISETSLREHVAFRLSWQLFLQENLDPPALEKHYSDEKFRFDGTRFKVTTIAVPVAAGQSIQRVRYTEKLTEFAGSKAVTPADWALEALAIDENAVVRSMEWVRGTGDLDPEIVSAILKLKEGQTSLPVQTSTSVQLVHLHQLEPGDRSFAEVKDDVRAHLLVSLLSELASKSQGLLPLKSAE